MSLKRTPSISFGDTELYGLSFGSEHCLVVPCPMQNPYDKNVAGFDPVENEIAAEHKTPQTEMLVAPHKWEGERLMFEFFGLLPELADERESTARTLSGDMVTDAYEIIARMERM